VRAEATVAGRIELGFGRSPIERSPPVLGKFTQIRRRDAVGPADTGQLVGPPGVGQSALQIVQLGLRNRYLERLDIE
jgi:hypothetical protein